MSPEHLPEPQPTWRKPVGVLGILLFLAIYALFVAGFANFIGAWPILLQMLFYLVAGIVWIFPVRPMLVWMETGRFRVPPRR